MKQMAVAVASWGQRNLLWITILRNDQLTLSGEAKPREEQRTGLPKETPRTITEKTEQARIQQAQVKGRGQHAPQEGKEPRHLLGTNY